jgi:HPt (histidine-containing phosphotransfer) domain-containing protein
MDDYISKPVRIGEIQDALEKWGTSRNPPNEQSTGEITSPVEDFLDFSAIEILRDIPASEGITALQEIIDLYLESAPAQISRIQTSIHDAEGLTKHSHALRSASLQVGAKRVAEIAAKMEELGRTRQLQPAPGLYLELTIAYADTKSRLLALR